MKRGARILGIAASDATDVSYLAGALVRVDRVVDGFAFETCTVAGLDATDATTALFDRLDREDCQALLCAGIAPAWFNLFDLKTIHDHTDRPVISISFESSQGLEPALREHFGGPPLERRLSVYKSLPPRWPLQVGETELYIRAVGCSDDRAEEIVRAVTYGDDPPEPIRVAQLAAAAIRTFRDEPSNA